MLESGGETSFLRNNPRSHSSSQVCFLFIEGPANHAKAAKRIVIIYRKQNKKTPSNLTVSALC